MPFQYWTILKILFLHIIQLIFSTLSTRTYKYILFDPCNNLNINVMSFKCTLGFHTWNGCKCTVCSKIRDEQHDLSNDCEKCSRCYAKRDFHHHWENGVCKTCGQSIFTYPRDGNVYKIITIGNQTLFAEYFALDHNRAIFGHLKTNMKMLKNLAISTIGKLQKRLSKI